MFSKILFGMDALNGANDPFIFPNVQGIMAQGQADSNNNNTHKERVREMRKIREISIREIREMEKSGVSSFAVRDGSPRGMHFESASRVKVGDKVNINNYFTLVTE